MRVHANQTFWQSPVYIRIGNGFPERIQSSSEAYESLIVRWPASSSAVYHEALSLCSAATTPAESARGAFIKAAADAEILDGEGKVYA